MNVDPLSPEQFSAEFKLGDSLLCYAIRDGGVTFSMLPAEKREVAVERRSSGPLHVETPVGNFRESYNTAVESLAQVALRGQPTHRMWTAGGTMLNSYATESLAFKEQKISGVEGHQCRIETILSSDLGFEISHLVLWEVGDPGIRIQTSIKNTGGEPLPIEMLSSFCLNNLTPFAADDAIDRLRLHRFRSTWSNEALHSVQDFGDLGLERTWGGGPVFLRYGQAGSLPVRKFHPWVAIEDKEESTFWGATFAWHGSWQMEVYRRDDPVSMSGGLGDFELAHWMKELQPGASFAAPLAFVACCVGGIDEIGSRLIDLQEHTAYKEPEHEFDLPIVFNEWCSSWGKPSHDYLIKTAERLQQTATRYLVIDDGWAEKPEAADIQYNGDWVVSDKVFPEGIGATTAAIRARGLIPGVWFEFEPCTAGTKAYEITDHQLQRDGKVLQVGNRHFWDFRDPWTFDYLTEKVIDLLRNNGFGYLKVDYNESIGLGCDGAESLGEGLRQHLAKVKEFFELIRQEVPGIVVENCASGGHRLEPGMVGVTSMSSFSDAHETVEIPVIAAALHRLIPAHKNQVWAVLRPDDTHQRLCYSLAATFLGRMCISGDVAELSDERFEVLQKAQAFYKTIVPILRSGESILKAEISASRRAPKGWQALVRRGREEESLLVVIHSFERNQGSEDHIVDLPRDVIWEVEGSFNAPDGIRLVGDQLIVPSLKAFSGLGLKLAPAG